MTDRNPDDLYDALRDRLADHGQEPPPELWAGIRAQLPPPVAAPQLRRHRQRVPGAWLFLITLTLVAVGAGWHWWGAQLPATAGLKAGRTASHTPTTNADRTSAANTQRPVAFSSAHPREVALRQPPTPQAPAAARRPAPGTATEPAGGALAGPAASKGLLATPGSTTRVAPAAGAAAAPAGAAASGSAKAAVAASSAPAGVTGRPARSLAAAKGLAANRGRRTNSATLAARWQTLGPGPGNHSLSGGSATSHLPESAYPAVAGPGAAGPGRHASTAATTRSAQALAFSETLPARPRRQPKAALTAVAKPTVGQPLPSSSTPPIVDYPSLQPALTKAADNVDQSTGSRLSQRAAQAMLPARMVAVHLATELERAAPQPVALVPSPLAVASRWAVQVVAGPALTYRTLSTATGAGMVASTSAPLVYTSATKTSAPVATLEQPALGSAAQATVRLALNGHWSLGTGLGYAEYASTLALQPVHAAAIRLLPNSLDSIAAIGIHRRDTYRFVTVPVRVGYGWTLSGRWRVGLLAGAEAAVYVGGSSTEGSPCACQSQTWSFANSPYRRVSLGASLGAEARYRLGGGRWELLAQPTATYLLSPLANYAPYNQRHLFGGAALLGVSFDLP